MDKAYIKCETLCGVPVVAFEDIEKAYPPDKFKMLIGIGYKDMNSLRELKFNLYTSGCQCRRKLGDWRGIYNTKRSKY